MTQASILLALGLVIVAEGLFYLFAPGEARRMLASAAALPDGAVRLLGLAVVAIGAAALAALALE
ncbi:DUF2065 domain-containing protein [Elioraea rosea]|uniref:DUF2065 domain-containing protein n=1 Tax=Elioraea rosea TaxID=2492390 RepID=UPI00118255B0|nr:DUF2065 family protein [Elioraea rosea]